MVITQRPTLFEKVNDLFLNQLIKVTTRYRTGEIETTHDWVITNCKDLVGNLSIDPALGEKSDHCTTRFELESVLNSQPLVERFNF